MGPRRQYRTVAREWVGSQWLMRGKTIQITLNERWLNGPGNIILAPRIF
jgi:hypothetical protein